MAQTSAKLIGPAERDKYWRDWARQRKQLRQYARQVRFYLAYRFSRWLGVSAKLFALQLLFVVAILVQLVVPLLIAVWKFSNQDPAAAGLPPWLAMASIAQTSGALIIGIYKSKSSISRSVGSQETERRRSVAHLLKTVQKDGAIDQTKIAEPTHCLTEVCRCIVRDAQELLQTAEKDVACVVLSYDAEDARWTGGSLLIRGRDRPGGPGTYGDSAKPALASYAYEAIRRRKTETFHDVRDAMFRSYFPDRDREYRSVLALPVTRPRTAKPHAILALNFRDPYILLGKSDELDRRLAPYVQFVSLFLSDGQSHADN